MIAQAVRLNKGWYIPSLQGIDDIKKDVVQIEVDLASEEFGELNYKDLKGIAIMERYLEKQSREDITHHILESQSILREKIGLKASNFHDALKEI